MKGEVIARDGYDKLWGWFGLSYASYLVLPRVLLHEMPDKWQGEMERLLREYDQTFPNQPDLGTRVQIIKNGKLVKTPSWLINYRHPEMDQIKQMKEI